MEKTELRKQIEELVGGFIYREGDCVYIDIKESLLDFILQELDKAREEVLLELLEKKTNYKIERVDHGYKVIQEYVLVSDIEKELSKLSNK